MPEGATFLVKLMAAPDINLVGVEFWKPAEGVWLKMGAGTRREAALPVAAELHWQASGGKGGKGMCRGCGCVDRG
jgi:hypothetical protein